jgi:hypothetical protein
MSKSSMVDPWITMKELCVVQNSEVEVAYQDWNDALQHTNTETNKLYKKKRKQLSTKLDNANKIAGQMELAVRAISRSRGQFPNVDDDDLQNRKGYVAHTQERLREISTAMRSQRTRDKVGADKRAALTTSTSTDASFNQRQGGTNDNTDFMQRNMDEQKEIRGQQDEILDNMSAGVDTFNTMAKEINTNLDEEQQLLAQFELEMEEAQAKMNVVLRSMAKLLNTKNTCQLWLIVFLIVTIGILSIFVFWID